ncbi:MAG: hypothetical protein M3Z33_11130 [Actinomycetota bacterium]|nr:hypothetical protein [Actinomycetota bacterium]
MLDAALGDAHRAPSGRLPPAEKIVANFNRKVVTLGSADASPPAGVTGFFSDGLQHASGVAVSALGRRLFIDSSGEVVSTNAEEHLLRLARGELATLPGT